MIGVLRQLLILVAALVVPTAVAAALGSHNLGTALFFGQVGFALAVIVLIMRR